MKSFAQTMITDHGAVNRQAVALAQRLKVTPEANDVSRQLQQGADEARTGLESKSGAAFDRAYMEREVQYHQAVLDALDKTLIPGAQNPELKACSRERCRHSRLTRSAPNRSRARLGPRDGTAINEYSRRQALGGARRRGAGSRGWRAPGRHPARTPWRSAASPTCRRHSTWRRGRRSYGSTGTSCPTPLPGDGRGWDSGSINAEQSWRLVAASPGKSTVLLCVSSGHAWHARRALRRGARGMRALRRDGR